jgi:hypothetical protein
VNWDNECSDNVREIKELEMREMEIGNWKIVIRNKETEAIKILPALIANF